MKHVKYVWESIRKIHVENGHKSLHYISRDQRNLIKRYMRKSRFIGLKFLDTSIYVKEEISHMKFEWRWIRI